MKNILDLDLEQVKEWMTQSGESNFRAKQVFDWLYKGVEEFEEMKNISSSLKDKMKAEFYIGIPKIEQIYKSKNGDTTKFIFAYADGNLIESVVMKYPHGNSICVSTQIGCRMGCTFCASTLDGVVRNLSAGEIVAQIIRAQKEIGERISNVVLMGSGEPLDNYENVTTFIKLINAEYGLTIGQRHITMSTCGIVPKIKELADQKLQITLAISLHAPNDELRKQMMPVANKYSLLELIESCNYYIEKTNRRITFEYALVSGVNDTVNHAIELAGLLKGMLCHVNLIPVNEIKEKEYKRSTLENTATFCKVLTSRGIETTIRKEMGTDINAACGQLRRSYISGQKHKGV